MGVDVVPDGRRVGLRGPRPEVARDGGRPAVQIGRDGRPVVDGRDPPMVRVVATLVLLVALVGCYGDPAMPAGGPSFPPAPVPAAAPEPSSTSQSSRLLAGMKPQLVCRDGRFQPSRSDRGPCSS